MARLFYDNGAYVIIADLQAPPSPAPQTRWSYHKTDVTSWSSLSALFSSTFATHKRIDILLANAGIGEAEDFFLDSFDEEGNLREPTYKVLNVNLKGALACVKLAVHYFCKNPDERGGKIVLTGSTAAYMNESIPIYQASKHALLGLMRAMRTPPHHSTSL